MLHLSQPITGAGNNLQNRGLKRARSNETAPSSPLNWVHKRPRGEEKTLHEAVKANNIASVKRLLEENAENKRYINNKNTDGDTALHIAAKKGSFLIIECLLEAGANPFKENKQGLAPVYVGAEHGQFAGVQILLDAMAKEPQAEGFWYTREQIAQKIENAQKSEPKTQKGREHHLDRLIENLTGESIELLNDPNELYKYASHLNSWVSSLLNTNDSGWYIDRALSQRARSICHILLEGKTAPAKSRDGLSSEKVREVLLDELVGLLNCLRADRRLSAIYFTGNYSAAASLSDYDVSQTMMRILSLDVGKHYTLPVSFPGHAMYLDIENKATKEGSELVFHLNNLGAGLSKGHEYDDLLNVLPRSFKIPIKRSANLQADLEAIVPQLHAFLRELNSCYALDKNADWQTLYRAFHVIERNLGEIFTLEEVKVDPEKEGWQAMKAQTSGNCSFKNITASMATRLGKPLTKWIKSEEKTFVRERSENVVTKDVWQNKEFEKESAGLLQILKNGNSKMLANFLAKKERLRGIAKKVPIGSILSLIKEGDKASLAKLFELGADSKEKDAYGSTLVHFAVREGKANIVELLIDLGLNVNEQNTYGQTPLHDAMEKQDPAIIRTLLENGALFDIKNAAGKTPLEILGEKKDDWQAIQDALRNHGPFV